MARDGGKGRHLIPQLVEKKLESKSEDLKKCEAKKTPTSVGTSVIGDGAVAWLFGCADYY